jgi:hypothetical protein
LIRYFQRRNGNGGLGLSSALALSELMMVVVGILLMPRGILDRSLGKTLALALLAGLVMAGTALGTRGVPSLVSAPIAVIAYGAALYVSGAISKQQAAELAAAVRRKLSRKATA